MYLFFTSHKDLKVAAEALNKHYEQRARDLTSRRGGIASDWDAVSAVLNPGRHEAEYERQRAELADEIHTVSRLFYRADADLRAVDLLVEALGSMDTSAVSSIVRDVRDALGEAPVAPQLTAARASENVNAAVAGFYDALTAQAQAHLAHGGTLSAAAAMPPCATCGK